MTKAPLQVSDQHARFIETARQLGCDEDEAAFDEKLKAVARQRLVAAAETKKAPK